MRAALHTGALEPVRRRRRLVFLDAGFPLSCYALSLSASGNDTVILDRESLRNVSLPSLTRVFRRKNVRWRAVSSRQFRLLRMFASFLQFRCVMTDPFCKAARFNSRCEILPDGASTLLLLDRKGVPFSLSEISAVTGVHVRPVQAGKVIFLGQNYVEFGAFDRAAYRRYLTEFAGFYDGPVQYIPHPRESTRPTDLPPSFQWVEPDLPIELRLFDEELLPERVFTFPSTATISIPTLFPSISVTCIDIKSTAIDGLRIFLARDATITHAELAAYIYALVDRHGLPISRMTLRDSE
jgi:hypothetical protein